MQTLTDTSAKRWSFRLTMFPLALLVVSIGVAQAQGAPPVNAGSLLQEVERQRPAPAAPRLPP